MPNCNIRPEMECLGVEKCKHLENSLNELKKEVQELRDKNREEHKEFYSRLEASERNQAVTQNQLAHIIGDTTEIKASMTAVQSAVLNIQMKPAKTWENVVSKVIELVVGLAFCALAYAVGAGGLV